jgi:hypothetical protein
MKADIQSQLETIDNQIAFPEFWDMVTEDLVPVRRRKKALETVLKAPVHEVDEQTIKYVYGESDG